MKVSHSAVRKKMSMMNEGILAFGIGLPGTL